MLVMVIIRFQKSIYSKKGKQHARPRPITGNAQSNPGGCLDLSAQPRTKKGLRHVLRNSWSREVLEGILMYFLIRK